MLKNLVQILRTVIAARTEAQFRPGSQSISSSISPAPTSTTIAFSNRPMPSIAYYLDSKSIECIRSEMRNITGEELVILEKDYVTMRRPCITYIPVGDFDDFSIAIFVIPPAHVLPLHDHPHMTVFSKVLWGSMFVDSCDFMNQDDADRRRGLAEINSVVHLHQDDIRVLHPNRDGNVHSFRTSNDQWCAVFDVLIPPYRIGGGRDCHFYQLQELDHTQRQQTRTLIKDGYKDRLDNAHKRLGWLQEIKCPESYYTRSARYQGPVIPPQN